MMGESTRSMLLSTTSFTAASNTVDPTADAAAAVEEMLTCYRACSPSESLHCICLGSSKSGKDISAMPFMPLDEQVAALRAASLSSEPIAKSSVAALQKTWLACVSEMLINSLTVGLTLEKGGSILLQDNQFLHYPVTSLGLLVIDPFYRTIEGFRTLIDHVWRHSNYPFCMQSGIGAEVGRHEFLLFLDCTWQIWMQFPNAFEFTDELLVLLCRALYSGRYGTFLGTLITHARRARHHLSSFLFPLSSFLFPLSSFLFPLSSFLFLGHMRVREADRVASEQLGRARGERRASVWCVAGGHHERASIHEPAVQHGCVSRGGAEAECKRDVHAILGR
jgi:hypothetical protein